MKLLLLGAIHYLLFSFSVAYAGEISIANFQTVVDLKNPLLETPLQVRFHKSVLYILDGNKNVIWKADDKFKNLQPISLQVGVNSPNGKKPEHHVTSFAINDGKIFALDATANAITVVDFSGNFLSKITLPIKFRPVYLEGAKQGILFSDSKTRKIYQISKNGSFNEIESTEPLKSPYSILPLEHSDNSELIVSDVLSNYLVPIRAKNSEKFSRFGAWQGRLFYPKGLTLRNSGDLFVSDSFLGAVQIFSMKDRSFVALVGTEKGITSWHHPISIAYDNDKNLLAVADPLRNLVTVLQDENKYIKIESDYRLNLFKVKAANFNTQSDLCFQCHDSSLMDNTALFSKTNRHPVNVDMIDNDHLSVSPDVPRHDGKIVCTSCHFPHAMEKTASFFRFSNNKNPNERCTKCHKFATQYKQHPIGLQAGSPKALELLRQHGAKTGVNNTIVCETCHNTHYARNHKLLNISDVSSEICLTCHDDRHYVKGVNHPISTTEMKNDRGCLNCHDLHYARPQTKGISKKLKFENFCLDCHQNHGDLVGSHHDVSGWNDSYKAKMLVNNQSSANPCLTCHATHGAVSGNNLLKRSAFTHKDNSNSDVISQQCLTCHSGKNARTIRHYKHQSPIPFKKVHFNSAEIDLFSKDGRKIKSEEVALLGCTSCHNPHMGKGQSQNSVAFTRDYKALSAFCSTCHFNEGLMRYKYFHTDMYRQKR